MHHVTGVPIVAADRADGCAATQGAACLGHRKWNLPTRQLLIPDPDGVPSCTHPHFNTPRPTNLNPPSARLPNTPPSPTEGAFTTHVEVTLGKQAQGRHPQGTKRDAGKLPQIPSALKMCWRVVLLGLQ